MKDRSIIDCLKEKLRKGSKTLVYFDTNVFDARSGIGKDPEYERLIWQGLTEKRLEIALSMNNVLEALNPFADGKGEAEKRKKALDQLKLVSKFCRRSIEIAPPLVILGPILKWAGIEQRVKYVDELPQDVARKLEEEIKNLEEGKGLSKNVKKLIKRWRKSHKKSRKRYRRLIRKLRVKPGQKGVSNIDFKTFYNSGAPYVVVATWLKMLCKPNEEVLQALRSRGLESVTLELRKRLTGKRVSQLLEKLPDVQELLEDPSFQELRPHLEEFLRNEAFGSPASLTLLDMYKHTINEGNQIRDFSSSERVDLMHAMSASRADIFVTNDKRLRKDVSCLPNGVKAVSLDEFIEALRQVIQEE